MGTANQGRRSWEHGGYIRIAMEILCSSHIIDSFIYASLFAYFEFSCRASPGPLFKTGTPFSTLFLWHCYVLPQIRRLVGAYKNMRGTFSYKRTCPYMFVEYVL